MHFQSSERKDKMDGIPIALEHCIELVDWIGKMARADKRDPITSDLPPIRDRLGISEETWLTIAYEFDDAFSQWIGSQAAIQSATRYVDKTRGRSPSISIG